MPSANPLSPPTPKPQTCLTWSNLPGASLSLAINQVIAQTLQPVVIITPDTLTAVKLSEELQFFHAQEHVPILHFPDWETLPYDYFSPHQDIISGRLATLSRLPTLNTGVIITPISTLMQRIPPLSYLTGHVFLLTVGEHLNIDRTRLYLEKSGYLCVPQVAQHGEFAVRGAIIDIFPMGHDLPLRIDLFDDEIDSIRTFSPETQLSLEKITKLELLPAKEFPLTEEAIELFRQRWRSDFTGNPLNCPMYHDISEGIASPGIEYYLPFFFKETATLFDYLPKDSLIINIDNTHAKAEEFWHEINLRYEQRRHDRLRPILPPLQLFIPTAEVFGAIQHYSNIKVQTTTLTDNAHHYFATSTPAQFYINHKAPKPLHELEAFLASYTGRVLFCAETAGRREALLQLFNTIKVYPKIYLNWEDFIADTAQYGIAIALLDEGLTLDDPAITVIAESQLFGKRIMQRRRRKETAQDPDAIIKDLTELQVGSPIVHIHHGVGRYLGLQTLDLNNQLTEFLCLEYADAAKLYVPVSSLQLINRYSGANPESAPLHRLGSEQWQRAKRKAAEQVRDVAAELLDIYAQREARVGFACQPADEMYESFAAAFPFEETPDQQKAIESVLADMALAKPMDRLVCGDVGFGKTEVAMRAAFMATHNNQQVVMLVPTTLLAQQHFQSFQDRFADWPVQVAVMSRFKTEKEQSLIIKNLADGKIDIIVGTHKLLQESIKFKSLGLVIIDEEHRFGVRQKERLKSMRFNVDILTLTATPIPRTLNMAFAGIRDLSLIATPPARRLSIKTFVQEYQKPIIQEAVIREILRGGQVYFLHNDVASIHLCASEITKLVPEARVIVAHGQMRERELEQVMADFYHRRYNVLVCTTIIESGIDIPSANTIIIERADKFGLAQLHQLRGRVGRSHHQAYAYLLTPPPKSMTSDAVKRLDAISSLENLGIGFTLATHDLEIRGAGELLGEGQSGDMQAVGFTLYMDLLARAVEALKSGKEPELEKITSSGSEVDLQIPALIPESYLGDVNLRLQFYKKIAIAKNIRELDEIQVEMIDRFGLLPDATKNLFAQATLKQTAEAMGITKIEASSKSGKLEFNDKPNIDPMKIIQLIQKHSNQFRIDGPTRLRFNLNTHERNDRIKLVEEILAKLA
jgi:transcription-repair coupling factor (superfamily II helicase)